MRIADIVQEKLLEDVAKEMEGRFNALSTSLCSLNDEYNDQIWNPMPKNKELVPAAKYANSHGFNAGDCITFAELEKLLPEGAELVSYTDGYGSEYTWCPKEKRMMFFSSALDRIAEQIDKLENSAKNKDHNMTYERKIERCMSDSDSQVIIAICNDQTHFLLDKLNNRWVRLSELEFPPIPQG
jgi:hypothetical protein